MKTRRSRRKRRNHSNTEQEPFFQETGAQKPFFDPNKQEQAFFDNQINSSASPAPIQQEEHPQLPQKLQRNMESAFGQDFSKIQIHKNSSKAKDLKAFAFTQGEQIHFAPGQFNPASANGKQLIGHEFSHVVQQRSSPIKPTQLSPTGIALNASPILEKEADRMGEQAITGKPIGNYTRTATADMGGASALANTAVTSPQAVAQRSALATWEEANDGDRFNVLNAKEQKKYTKQQGKLAAGKKVKNPIALPTVEKILRLKANYHYFSQFPSNDPGNPFQLGGGIISEVKRQFRMNTSPDFFPDINWLDKDGNARKIGVRFDVNFISQAAPTNANDPDHTLDDNPINATTDVQQNPWDNTFLLQHIDRISNYGAVSLESWMQQNNITTIVFQNNYEEAVYTPHDGSAVQNFAIPNQLLDLKRLIRQEYSRVGGDPQKLRQDASGSEVLGRGNLEGITVDPRKTAPNEPITFPKYERMAGQEDNYRTYRSEVEPKFKEQENFVYPAAERNKRIAAVIAHEIGHNIGFTHTDLGIMSESAEATTKMRIQTAIYRNPNAVQGGEVYAWQIKYDLGADQVQAENVQSLVDRIRTFTEEMPQTRDATTNILLDKTDLWGQQRDQFFALLDANDFAAIFASTMFLSLLYLPFETDLSETLVSRGTITSSDAETIRRIAQNRSAASISDWNGLSQGARDYIVGETKRLLRRVGGSGMTYFETVNDMNAF